MRLSLRYGMISWMDLSNRQEKHLGLVQFAMNKTGRSLENGRLAYYRSHADSQFWDQHWKDILKPDAYRMAEMGHLGYLERVFTRWLPKDQPILEAGCGIGQFVLALRKRGYQCEGVEWAPETVKAVRDLYPDLPVRTGDVLHLEVPDEFYGAYISLGVIEHRQDGPEPFLMEARRVLRKDGVLLVSVPYFHILRRVKATLGFYRDSKKGMEFYQQAFRISDLNEILNRCGFSVLEIAGYDPYKGLKDEVPLAKLMFNLPVIGSRLMNLWGSIGLVQRYLGHMILFVCRKSG